MPEKGFFHILFPMTPFSGFGKRLRSKFVRYVYLLDTKFRAGKIRLEKKLEPYILEKRISERIQAIGSVQTEAEPDWSQNLPPFTYWESQEETVFPNAKRKVRTKTFQRTRPWLFWAFLPWKKRALDANPLSLGFSPIDQDSAYPVNSRKLKKSSFRSKPYFWEAWFPQISTLTLSPLVIWEAEVKDSTFKDCLPETIIPFGTPGKWKVRIYSMRVLSHQLGSLYEDFYPSPYTVHRSEVWVFGYPQGPEIHTEELKLYPLGVWLQPSFLQDEAPRLRVGLPFRTGETSWQIQGKIVSIRIRELQWNWKQDENPLQIQPNFSSPHIALGKHNIRLVPESYRPDVSEAYLFKRALVSDPKFLHRSIPSKNRSGVSPKPTRI
ncbi:hypothetical protein [Leptospira broomii]|uniref:hypothetical protein n=1 Tax=Leptospira broomii TaxID=301541 RepID=UPI0018DE8EB9|nr:hypothetical protein [Leptospira broomii]